MKRALVTGADGMLGNNLVRELLDRGYSVSVLLHPLLKNDTLSQLPLKTYLADITHDSHVINIAVENSDIIFHCAAITNINADKDVMDQVNVVGTMNIINACLRGQKKRLIFVGSASSFSQDENGDIPEEYRGNPYIESKKKAMSLILESIKKNQLDAVIVAPTFMIGPFDVRPSSGEIILK